MGTLDKILRLYRARLLGQARHWCGKRFDPEDLVQEVCLYAVGHPLEMITHPQPWNWLALVMKHRFLDRVRREQHRGVQDGDPDAEMAKDLRLTKWMDWEELELAIRHLPLELQKVVRLRLDDLPFREIAEDLGCSIAKAHKSYLEACLQLSAYLKSKDS